jgi:hypothetical protein
MLYSSIKQGCSIPSTGFDGHGPPILNEAVTFDFSHNATSATSWTPGAKYIVTIPSYTTNAANMWLHVTSGTLAPPGSEGATAEACANAYYSTLPAMEHAVIWMAPGADADPCVTFSAAQADSSTTAYQTNTVRLWTVLPVSTSADRSTNALFSCIVFALTLAVCPFNIQRQDSVMFHNDIMNPSYVETDPTTDLPCRLSDESSYLRSFINYIDIKLMLPHICAETTLRCAYDEGRLNPIYRSIPKGKPSYAFSRAFFGTPLGQKMNYFYFRLPRIFQIYLTSRLALQISFGLPLGILR